MCLSTRNDAQRALKKLRGTKLQGNQLKVVTHTLFSLLFPPSNTVSCRVVLQVDWAPGTGVRETEYQRSFDKRDGVAYVPFQRLSNVDLTTLSAGGFVDESTLPASMQPTSK